MMPCTTVLYDGVLGLVAHLVYNATGFDWSARFLAGTVAGTSTGIVWTYNSCSSSSRRKLNRGFQYVVSNYSSTEYV